MLTIATSCHYSIIYLNILLPAMTCILYSWNKTLISCIKYLFIIIHKILEIAAVNRIRTYFVDFYGRVSPNALHRVKACK